MMQDLRDAPGYAAMEDYYDTDYEPRELLDRYEALQLELRRRREQHFTALSQANGLAVTFDGLATTSSTSSPLFRTSGSSPFSSRHPFSERADLANQQRPGSLSLPRSPQASVPRRVSGTSPLHGGRGASISGGGSIRRSREPRTSVALEDLYAARQGSPSQASMVAAASRPSLPFANYPVASTPSASFSAVVSTDGRATSSQSARRNGTRASPRRRVVITETSDPYDAAAEVRRQERFLSESKRLGKPFVPSSSNSALEVPSRFMLGDCVKLLYRSLAPDWREAAPMVVSTAEDLIAVYFSLDKLAKTQVTTLLQYMNASLKHNSTIREFHLTKVPEGWDVLTNDGYVMYTFRPPWVTKRAFLPDTVAPPHAHLLPHEEE